MSDAVEMKSLDIFPETLGHLLTDKMLQVPYYQREYSWKDTHVQELFDDLRRAIENGGRDYFLGSIVACRLGDGKFEIVDGQQRLATTTILLGAMRDYAHKLGEERAVEVLTSKFLYRARSITEGDDEFNLTLSETDNDFFKSTIVVHPDHQSTRLMGQQREHIRDSHRRIRQAARKAKDHVKAITANKKTADAAVTLQKWMSFIEFQTKIILVVVSNHDEAYIIFETLNDRGLDLSIADLTKNYLFLKSGEKVEETKAKWNRMVGALEAVSDRDITRFYIHHLWCSLYGVAKDRDIFSKIRAKINSRADALEFAESLSENSRIYAALRNSDHEFWSPYGSEARQHIRALSSSLRVTQIHILLLAVLSKFSETEVKRFLPYTVCWSVRFLIAGGTGGSLEGAYASHAVQVTKGEITKSTDLVASLKKNVPNNTTFVAAFESATVQSNYLARYYLQCLERAATRQPNPHLAEDNETLGSLEHVLPQSPDLSVWNVTEQKHNELYRRIGNLALMPADDNSNRGNRSFVNAKQAYAKCHPFQLTKELANYGDEWGEVEISSRQRKLAEYALQAWPHGGVSPSSGV